MDEIVKNFGLEWVKFGAYTLNFIILAYLLNRLAYKPTLAMLKKRKDIIKNSLKEAKAIEIEKKEMQVEYKKLLQEAHNESKKTINEAIKQAEVLTNQITTEARAEAEKILKKAEEEIALERTQMHKELKKDIATLLSLTLSKVLKNNLSEDTHKKIIESALNEID